MQQANGEVYTKPLASPLQQFFFNRLVTTAPPKPLAQTQFILDAMSTKTDDEKSRWEQVMQNFDLVFQQMNDISIQQQELKKGINETKDE